MSINWGHDLCSPNPAFASGEFIIYIFFVSLHYVVS